MPKHRGQNEGMIRERPDGTWEARMSLGRDIVTGKRKTKSLYGKTKEEVRRELVRLQKDKQSGLPIRTERQNVQQFLTYWLESVVKPSLRPKTYVSYKQIVDNHLVPALGHIPLHKLAPQDVQTFLAEKHAKGISAEHLRRVLRTALAHAYRLELVARNSASMVKPPARPTKEFTPFNEDQARAFMKAVADHRFGPLFVLAIATGLREGELLGLQWQDVDLDKFTISVRKQIQPDLEGRPVLADLKTEHSRRTLSIPLVAVDALRRHQKDQQAEGPPVVEHFKDLVFKSTTGTPLDPSKVRKALKNVIDKANNPDGDEDQQAPEEERVNLPSIRFHDLRHSAATLLKTAGADLHTIKDVLGHSQIAITANLYTHTAPPIMRDAADRMQSIFETANKPAK